ncbi:MAG: sporulation protein YabP [Thermaerobacterales bacterium]
MAENRPTLQMHGTSTESVHEVVLKNREELRVRGVLHVESFDDRQIILDTDLGTLTIEGEDLEIKQLDLEAGNFSVSGLVAGLTYSMAGQRQNQGRGKGFFERLLR